MNRQTFFTFGGALLATTALTSGAMAGTVGTISDTSFTAGAIKVANTVFSTTATTADAITVGSASVGFGIQFCPTCSMSAGAIFAITGTVAGGTAVAAGLQAATHLLIRSGTATGLEITTGTAYCTGSLVIAQNIYVSGCAVTASSTQSVGGILFSGLSFTTANVLAGVGASITLSGNVVTTTPAGLTVDTFSGALITSAAPLTATITAAANGTLSALSTPNAFIYLQSAAGTYGTTVYTMALASVVITAANSVFTNDLTTALTLATIASSVSVTVTSGVLTNALAEVHITDNVGGGAITVVNPSIAGFGASSTLTFSINTTAFSQFTVAVVFDGTTQIPASLTAGTVTLKIGTKGGTFPQANAAVPNGTTATLNRSGFAGEVNSLYSTAISKLTTPAYNSYIRIHNNGSLAGAATVTVYHDADGTQIGSPFVTSTIAPGATLTLSASQLESSVGVTTSQIELYTVKVSGPFLGYMQHVVYNPTSGQINDLSSFRNAGNTINTP